MNSNHRWLALNSPHAIERRGESDYSLSWLVTLDGVCFLLFVHLSDQALATT